MYQNFSLLHCERTDLVTRRKYMSVKSSSLCLAFTLICSFLEVLLFSGMFIHARKQLPKDVKVTRPVLGCSGQQRKPLKLWSSILATVVGFFVCLFFVLHQCYYFLTLTCILINDLNVYPEKSYFHF